jgi:xanthine/uracil/vitamin C permease (AzgA family)
MPFGLAPGIGLSTYLAYGLMMGAGLTKTEAFTTVYFLLPYLSLSTSHEVLFF